MPACQAFIAGVDRNTRIPVADEIHPGVEHANFFEARATNIPRGAKKATGTDAAWWKTSSETYDAKAGMSGLK